MIKEHVHRAMVCICGTTFAIAGLLGLLMLYLVYLAMHVGEPVRPRAAVETSTTTYSPPVYTGHPRHYKAGVPSECLRQPAFHVCRENDSFPEADRFDKWRGIDGNASGRPWYFLHGSCFEWAPESFCLDRSGAHFTNRKKCAQRCEKDAPQKQCTDLFPDALKSNCSSKAEELAPPRWFFDPRAHRCRKWRDVCVRPAFSSYRSCMRRCRRRRNVHG